jgi:hypothetical protein
MLFRAHLHKCNPLFYQRQQQVSTSVPIAAAYEMLIHVAQDATTSVPPPAPTRVPVRPDLDGGFATLGFCVPLFVASHQMEAMPRLQVSPNASMQVSIEARMLAREQSLLPMLNGIVGELDDAADSELTDSLSRIGEYALAQVSNGTSEVGVR